MNCISRRGCLSALARGVLGIPILAALHSDLVLAEESPDSEEGAKIAEIVDWMNAWMAGSKTPVGALHLSRFKDPVYFLTKPISWKPNPGQEDLGEVQVPKGFVTDLTSVPRIFWSILRPDGDYTYPAIIHDYLYWRQEVERDKADLIFRHAMEDFDVGSSEILVIYNAVRLGGGAAWDDNAQEKSEGGKRILTRFPQDPRITWDEWRKRPRVFDPVE